MRHFPCSCEAKKKKKDAAAAKSKKHHSSRPEPDEYVLYLSKRGSVVYLQHTEDSQTYIIPAGGKDTKMLLVRAVSFIVS